MSIKLAASAAFLSAALVAAMPQARAGAPMPTAGLVVPPGGFIGFCARHLRDCSAAAGNPAVVELTDAHRQQLDAVQARVNAAIQWRDDPQHVWDYPTDGTGDCNKFALEKRRELIALGWPAGALLLTTAMTEHNEAHLVLIARTGDGDLVLDNRLGPVVDWTRLPYRWMARQSEASPALWVDVPARAITIADARHGARPATP